jgi:hypothetical protein
MILIGLPSFNNIRGRKKIKQMPNNFFSHFMLAKTENNFDLLLSKQTTKSKAGWTLSMQFLKGIIMLSRESGEEDLGVAGLIGGAYSAGPVSPTCST